MPALLRQNLALVIGAALLLAPEAALLAQGPAGPKYAVVSAKAQPATLAPGGHGALVIHMVVAPGFHVNSSTPKDPSLIATAFAPAAEKGVRFSAAKYPKQEMVMSAGQSVAAYQGAFNITVPFMVVSTAHRGVTSVAGTLTYQGCNATACYPPKQETVHATVTVK